MIEASAWAVFLTAILSSSVVGGIVSGVIAIYTNRTSSAAEKKKRKAEKFEELVTVLFEFDHWQESKRTFTVYGTGADVGISPFAKLEAIAATYFPAFDPLIKDLRDKSLRYSQWMYAAQMKRIKNTSPTLPDLNEGFLEIYNPYYAAFIELLDQLKNYARKELR